MRNQIKNKINNICDCLCLTDCSQFWKGECRAFQVPHSDEEKKSRERDTGLCQISVLSWAYQLNHPERHKCDFVDIEVEESVVKVHKDQLGNFFKQF